MADKYIWTGTDWESLQGPQGPEGPSAVSADAGNASTIGSDGLIYTPVGFTQAQADTRYVELTGDTMTGGLVLDVPAQSAAAGQVQVRGDEIANITLTSCGDPKNGAGKGSNVRFIRARGTVSSPQDVQAADVVFSIAGQSFFGGAFRQCGNIQYVVDSPQAGDTFARTRVNIGTGGGTIGSATRLVLDSNGNCGINWTNPTRTLEVGGNSILRGSLEIVGNFTSAGTAHSFVAGSIPGPAVLGGAATTPDAATAAAAGSIRWDESFLYVRTETAWKKIPLSAL